MIYRKTTLANWVFHVNKLNKESELYIHDVKQSEELKPQLCIAVRLATRTLHVFHLHDPNAAATLLPYLVAWYPRMAAEIALQQLSVNSHQNHHAQCCSTWVISGSHHATNHLLESRPPCKIFVHKGATKIAQPHQSPCKSPLSVLCRASVELAFLSASQSSTTSSTPSFRKSAAALWEDKCADAMFDHVSYPKHVPSTYHDALQRLATFHGTLTQD